MLFLVLTRLGRCNFRTTARGTAALYAHGCRDASALFVLWRGMPEGDAMLCKLRMPARGSVVLVPTDSPDVVPCIGLVAEEALRDVRVLDPCDRHRDHVKVLHVMAGRGLVALGAIHGERRGVAELGDVPGTRGVTRGQSRPKRVRCGSWFAWQAAQSRAISSDCIRGCATGRAESWIWGSTPTFCAP